MLSYFNPCLGQIWTNPTVGFKKNAFQNINQQLGGIYFWPKHGFKQPSIF